MDTQQRIGVSEPRLTPLGQEIASDPRIHQGLYLAARRHMRSVEDGEDLYCEMVTRGLEDEAKGLWSPRCGVSAFDHLRKTLIGIAGNRRKQRRLRAARNAQVGEAEDAPTSAPDPERALIERNAELARRKLIVDAKAALAAKGEALPLAILEWGDKGVSSRRELARRIGCGENEIQNALRRAKELVKKLMANPGGES